MFSGENIFLFGHGYVGIDLSNINGAVSKHSLYIPDINVLLQKEGGEGMPEHMGSDMLANSGKLNVAVNHKAHRLIG